jgi:hypothetical protein
MDEDQQLAVLWRSLMEQRDNKLLVVAVLSTLLALSSISFAQNSPSPASESLKLLISLKKTFVAPPESARIVLHLHNSTSQPLWLYRRARGKKSPEELVDPFAVQVGGSTVELQLAPTDSAAGAVVTAASATVLEYVQMPKPRLAKVSADGDYEETAIVQLHPALAEGNKPIWGAYQLRVIYRANYPNVDVFKQTLAVNLWQGEVASNAVSIELRPPLPDSVGEIDGTAVGVDLTPRAAIRISLSDAEGQLMDQRVTGVDGRFTFDHLPMALYWITGHREDATQDTVVFTHQELASALTRATVQLTFVAAESEDPKKFIRKPVLLRVVDSNQHPIVGVGVEAILTQGPLIDDLKAVTDVDGTAPMELIPGRNAISLKLHGCEEQVERADVAPGAGVDGYKYVYDCAKK